MHHQRSNEKLLPISFQSPAKHNESYTHAFIRKEGSALFYVLVCYASHVNYSATQKRRDSPRKNPPATVTSCSGHKMPNINFWALYQTNASFHCSSLLLWGWFYLQRIRNFFFDHDLLLWINKRNFQILKLFNKWIKNVHIKEPYLVGYKVLRCYLELGKDMEEREKEGYFHVNGSPLSL